MIKLEGVRLPPGAGEAELRAQAARLLRLRPEALPLHIGRIGLVISLKVWYDSQAR